MQLLRNLICLLLVFASIHTQAQQTYSITGTVSDEKGQPVHGATVFLTNTKMATSTDEAGKFVLNRLSPGNYELVVKMLGFESGRRSIQLHDRSPDFTFKLKESSTLLKAVTINSGPSKNDEYLQIFIKNFVGSSANSAECKILNTEVLNFTRDKKKNTMLANADDFLVVENEALGYKIKYLLKKFVYYFEYEVCYYDGDPYFEELKGTAEQQKQWDENRKKAYLGSYRHFFRTIMSKRSAAEGFIVYKPKNAFTPTDQAGMKPVDIDTLLTPIDANFKALVAKPIVLNKKDTIRRTLYVFYSPPTQPQELTRVIQFADTVLIDKTGGLAHGMTFSLHGRWGEQRVADLTPVEYFIDPLAEKK